MKIYTLEELFYGGNKNADGEYWFSKNDRGVYSSLKGALRTMRELLKEQNKQRIGFWIFERVVDQGRVGPFNLFCRYESVRAYYADGRMMCYSPYDHACRREFKGRDPREVPLKGGELAWSVGGDRMSPVLVGDGPATKREWRAMAKRCKRKGHKIIGLDCSDDCYFVYTYDNGHDHPAIWGVFPYFGTISMRNKNRLLKTRKWYDDGCPDV